MAKTIQLGCSDLTKLTRFWPPCTTRERFIGTLNSLRICIKYLETIRKVKKHIADVTITSTTTIKPFFKLVEFDLPILIYFLVRYRFSIVKQFYLEPARSYFKIFCILFRNFYLYYCIRKKERDAHSIILLFKEWKKSKKKSLIKKPRKE